MTQTALQQAIGKLRGKIFPPRSNVALGVIMSANLLEEFLELEKGQIAEAFNEGYTYGGHEVETINGEQYYKEKFEGQGSPDK